MRIYGYINIYRSGVYHSEGKAGAFNRHGGDVYATFEAATEAIHPASHYVDTLAINWEDGDTSIRPNPD